VGEDNNTKVTTHKCKDPINQCNHFNIDAGTEEKYWKLHLELKSKNCKKDTKKKNLITMDLSNQVKRNYDVDENIVFTSV
jgi:hypothetical protein